MIVDAEWTHRDNKRNSRSLKEAKLRYTQATIESIEYGAKRELEKAVVKQLASCRWVKEHQAILITGMTGKRRDLLEVLEDRHDTRSTIFTSQLDPSHWHDYLADPTLADAICDRILGRAHRLVLKGPSRQDDSNK